MLKKKLSGPKIRYERQKKPYLLFYYFFAYLFLSQYGRKYCLFGTKMTGKLHVHFQYILELAPFALIPGPLEGIILTGVHLVSVFSNKHTVTHDCSASWKQICFRFHDLCFPLLHPSFAWFTSPAKKKNQTNIHIATRAFLRYEGQLLSACFVLILSILGFRVT